MLDEEIETVDSAGNESADTGNEAESDSSSVVIETSKEAIAKAIGWKPKDEYRGRPEDWQDADAFLGRNAALQSEVKELRERVSAKDEEYAQRIKRIEAANERLIREDRERLIRELRQQRRTAAELGDIEELDRLENEEDKYWLRVAEQEKQDRQAQERPRAPDLLPETQDWIRRNSWFNESQSMQQIALGFYNEALEGMPANKDESKRLAYVDKKMSEVYPDKFGGGNKSSAVESGSRQVANNPVTKLTAEERSACKRFIARGIIKNEAEYIKYLNEYDS